MTKQEMEDIAKRMIWLASQRTAIIRKLGEIERFTAEGKRLQARTVCESLFVLTGQISAEL